MEDEDKCMKTWSEIRTSVWPTLSWLSRSIERKHKPWQQQLNNSPSRANVTITTKLSITTTLNLLNFFQLSSFLYSTDIWPNCLEGCPPNLWDPTLVHGWLAPLHAVSSIHGRVTSAKIDTRGMPKSHGWVVWHLGEPSKKKWEKLVFWTNQGGGGSDRIPTFWQNFPKLNLPCNCP